MAPPGAATWFDAPITLRKLISVGLVYLESPSSVRDLATSNPRWDVPEASKGLSRNRATLAGRSFFWINPPGATGPAGVRRHAF